MPKAKSLCRVVIYVEDMKIKKNILDSECGASNSFYDKLFGCFAHIL